MSFPRMLTKVTRGTVNRMMLHLAGHAALPTWSTSGVAPDRCITGPCGRSESVTPWSSDSTLGAGQIGSRT
jgi:hypothetical protein